MNYEGEKFLLKLYRELYKEENVLKAEKRNKIKSSNKYESINKYLDRLENLEKIFDNNHKKMERYILNKFCQKYVIKKENIPESYWKFREQIELEKGYGHIKVTKQDKQDIYFQLKTDQESRIKQWINYLLKENTNYPMWARYWAFQGMLKLGNYDNNNHRFNKRSKGTTANFPELNAEVLAKTIEIATKFVDKDDISDENTKEIIETGSFGKLYAYNLWKINIEKKENPIETITGKWTKYKNGDSKKVVSSLEGHGTGWCIASEEMAKEYLSYGELDIYYSVDENGGYTIPRACIRTENKEIQEVRGILEHQNMEPEMLDIVDKKLDEYPDKQEYKKKVNDMKKLTEITNKINRKETLSNEELYFLFEVDDEIIGFGWDKDPRVEESIKKIPNTSDKNFMYNIISKNWRALKYASNELKEDPDFALIAIKQNPFALDFVSEKLKGKKEIVLAAVKQDGEVLDDASKELKKDKDIIIAAICTSFYAPNYVDKEVLQEIYDDKKTAVEILKQQPYAFKPLWQTYITDRVDDRELALAMVQGYINCGWQAQRCLEMDISKKLLNDSSFMNEVNELIETKNKKEKGKSK